jgi:hypothetical protein
VHRHNSLIAYLIMRVEVSDDCLWFARNRVGRSGAAQTLPEAIPFLELVA